MITRFIIILLLFSYSTVTQSITFPNYLSIDFHQAMPQGTHYSKVYAEQDHQWKQLISLYDKYIMEHQAYKTEPRIPKIIHQIWLGGPFPEKYKKFQQSWIDKHPDWEYKLWTDEEIDKLYLQNRQIYNAISNPGIKADIARLEILDQFGGLYIDTDFECLQPFDIFHHCCDFYAGCSAERSIVIFNGLIGSIPNHPILKECINTLSIPSAHMTPSQLYGLTGPFFLTKHILKNLTLNQPWVILPSTYFYPWPHYTRKQNRPEQIQYWIKPESFAIHHWYVAWNDGKNP